MAEAVEVVDELVTSHPAVVKPQMGRALESDLMVWHSLIFYTSH